jgi:hypothetical protein
MALVAFAASQALTGCNSTPAPAPAQPAVAPPTGGGSGKSVVELNPPDPHGTNWSAGHGVKSNDEVIWKAPIEFFVEFKQGQNPCGPDTYGGGTGNQYKSKLQGNHYEAKCTVANPSATNPWVYQVTAGAPILKPTKPKKPLGGKGKFYVIPCDGCLLELDQ